MAKEITTCISHVDGVERKRWQEKRTVYVDSKGQRYVRSMGNRYNLDENNIWATDCTQHPCVAMTDQAPVSQIPKPRWKEPSHE